MYVRSTVSQIVQHHPALSLQYLEGGDSRTVVFSSRFLGMCVAFHHLLSYPCGTTVLCYFTQFAVACDIVHTPPIWLICNRLHNWIYCSAYQCLHVAYKLNHGLHCWGLCILLAPSSQRAYACSHPHHHKYLEVTDLIGAMASCIGQRMGC